MLVRTAPDHTGPDTDFVASGHHILRRGSSRLPTMDVAPTDRFARLERATRDLDPPFAVVDLATFDANADDLVRRAAGRPIRVASKSLRCRAMLARALARPGFRGVLAFTLAEARWLVELGVSDDVVVAYPTVDRVAIRGLAGDPRALAAITLMIDDVAQLDVLDAACPANARVAPIRVALELDASYRLARGRIHLGPRRSPVHDERAAVRLARAIVARPGVRLVGLMAYEGQIAGLADDVPGSRARGALLRGLQARSARELAGRRARVVAAVGRVAPLEFVNGGGTGSLETTAMEAAVTEVAAGSGLYGPTLFDGYRAFRPGPAAVFALPVVRRPGSGLVTVLGGGWVASGPAGRDRLPTPVHPAGLRLTALEGAGEVQTPLAGAAADALRVGDRVWFRHAKAGELAEHVDVLHLVNGDVVVDGAPTYRGEGHAFL